MGPHVVDVHPLRRGKFRTYQVQLRSDASTDVPLHLQELGIGREYQKIVKTVTENMLSNKRVGGALVVLSFACFAGVPPLVITNTDGFSPVMIAIPVGIFLLLALTAYCCGTAERRAIDSTKPLLARINSRKNIAGRVRFSFQPGFTQEYILEVEYQCDGNDDDSDDGSPSVARGVASTRSSTAPAYASRSSFHNASAPLMSHHDSAHSAAMRHHNHAHNMAMAHAGVSGCTMGASSFGTFP